MSAKIASRNQDVDSKPRAISKTSTITPKAANIKEANIRMALAQSHRRISVFTSSRSLKGFPNSITPSTENKQNVVSNYSINITYHPFVFPIRRASPTSHTISSFIRLMNPR